MQTLPGKADLTEHTSKNDMIRCLIKPVPSAEKDVAHVMIHWYLFTCVYHTGPDLGHLVDRNRDAIDCERGQL